ncbi:hypothetical protein GGR52DRAFT_581609 [Hypoxylon sp. FL1284]|nr:hypothetical protein GGR52DRAFT_581609 [Hypoxylon sp. FL1284]
MASSDCREVLPSEYWNVSPVPDISGLGVLIGFIATAYALLLIVCLYYIVTFNPSLDPHRDRDGQSERPYRANPFDQLILQVIRRVLLIKAPEKRRRHVSEALQKAFNKCVLSMADTQVFTGLAIIVSGYLCRLGLSALHWKMIVYLAWFSCATHLSVLVFLRNYLINHPAERVWRLISMLVLLVVLVVATIPTGHFYWDNLIYEQPYSWGDEESQFDAAPSANATCYFNTEFKPGADKARNSMIVSIILLVFGFTTKLLKLHRKFLCFEIESISRAMVEKVLLSAAFFQRALGTSNLEDRVASNMVVAAHLTVCVWVDLYTSMASDIYWLIVSLAWGTLKISNLLDLLNKSSSADNTWTFGQFLPVLLLALPLGWILRPEFLDEYYRGSIWMFWVVTICNAYTVLMTYFLLQPGYSYNTRTGQYELNDTVSQAQNLVLPFIFVQGATVQVTILLSSLVEMKLKYRWLIHMLLFIGVSNSMTMYGFPMLSVVATFTMFIIALIIKIISGYLRSCVLASRVAQPDELLLTEYHTWEINSGGVNGSSSVLVKGQK